MALKKKLQLQISSLLPNLANNKQDTNASKFKAPRRPRAARLSRRMDGQGRRGLAARGLKPCIS